MSETSEILAATVNRLFGEQLGDDAARAARRGVLSAKGWLAVEDAGLPAALLPEDAGGFGLPAAEAFNLVRIGGMFASPVPLGETMVANWMLTAAGLSLVEGPSSFAAFSGQATREASRPSHRVAGTVEYVPWGRHARSIVLVGDSHVFRVSSDQVRIVEGAASNGLPRDKVEIDAVLGEDAIAQRPAALAGDIVMLAGALIRTMEIAGALRRVLALTTQYAGERVQFGRPIGKLQAIQQLLAELAGQVATADAAAGLAAESFGDADAMLAVAAGKARAGEAAGISSAIAHQVHGAIGYTQEHPLHLYTRALWAWRDEYGGERRWQHLLGSHALANGADGFWPFVTTPTLTRIPALVEEAI